MGPGGGGGKLKGLNYPWVGGGGGGLWSGPTNGSTLLILNSWTASSGINSSFPSIGWSGANSEFPLIIETESVFYFLVGVSRTSF